MSSSLSLLDHFSVLDDPRQRWRVIYPLPEILLLVLCATLCGMDDFVEIRLWGEQRLDFLRLFADPPPGLIADTHESLDADHGRFERRRHSVCHDVTWPTSDRRYPHEPHVPHLAMIGMSETAIERGGKTVCERRYYLASAKLDAKTFAAAVRAHWHVENRLHWVLDVVFHDDLVRLRTGFGPQNMAVVRHIAMNLVRAPHDRHSLKNRRKLANLSPDYLETLIRQNAAPAALT